jgi:hypothetical protein
MNYWKGGPRNRARLESITEQVYSLASISLHPQPLNHTEDFLLF